jgi:hypothetical protein
MKVMRVHGTKRLEKFRVQVWNNADEKKYGFLPPQVFLPDSDIKLVLDYFTLLDSLAKVSALVGHNSLLDGWHNGLLETICELQNDFERIKQEQKEKLRANRAAKKAAKERSNLNDVEVDLDSEQNSESESRYEDNSPREQGGTSGIRWQINLR